MDGVELWSPTSTVTRLKETQILDELLEMYSVWTYHLNWCVLDYPVRFLPDLSDIFSVSTPDV